MPRIVVKRAKYLAATVIDAAVGLGCGVGLIRAAGAVPIMRAGSKVALIALDQLGDAVMATSCVEALKFAFPRVEVTVVTRGCNESVFRNNPHISSLLLDDAPWWSGRPLLESLRPAYWVQYLRRIHRLRAARYDVVVDLRGDLRHLLLFGVAVGPRCLLGYSRTGGKGLLSVEIPWQPDAHEIDRKLALLRPLGVVGIRPGPKIWLLPEELRAARERVVGCVGDSPGPLVLMDPGGKAVQRWPVERFAALARRLSHNSGRPVLVSAGPAFVRLAEGLVRVAGPDSARLLGEVSIRELAAVVASCDLLVSSDTGVAHVASAVGTPAVTLFGPTDPERFWHGVDGGRPIQGAIRCCTRELHEECLKTEPGTPGLCILSIRQEEVADAVSQALERIRTLRGKAQA